jgi:hypothetical protein
LRSADFFESPPHLARSAATAASAATWDAAFDTRCMRALNDSPAGPSNVIAAT